MAARHWLVLGAALCTAAFAGEPPQAPTAPPAVPQRSPDPTDAAASDDDFIEFLGEDDVGDAAWWEFLKKSAPPKEPHPLPPTQDAKQ
jgi:hypothetical protein